MGNKHYGEGDSVLQTLQTNDCPLDHTTYPGNSPRSVILIYVPGTNFNVAAEHIAESYNRAVNQTGDQSVFILGEV